MTNLPAVRTLTTHSPAETFDLGKRLGRLLAPGQVIALSGDLGAGKTTLTQGIAAGLGIDGPITSPTFTLINEYQSHRDLRLLHVDVYRLGESSKAAQDVDSSRQVAREAEAIGLDEMLADDDAIVIVEWAERIAPLLPPDHLEIRLAAENDETTRTIKLTAHGPTSQTLLAALTT